MTPFVEDRIVGHDGTELAVRVAGEGPLVVLANGLGGSLGAWRPFLERLSPGRCIASWDYRGLYKSGPPARPHAVTVEDHARDLGAVLDWLGGGPAVLVGWSMGVQVVVERALDQPRDAAGLVLVSGAPGDPLAGVLHTAASRHLVPPLTWAVEAAALPFGLAMRALTVAPRPAVAALRGLGVLADGVDMDVFADLAHDFARLDWRVYTRTVRAMGRHDAWGRLGELRVPTLVVGGTADRFLPTATVEAMARVIPAAELCLLEGATHYLPVEFPGELAACVDRFLAERVRRARR
ncbi:MAG TPA: alpha/beta hydrolase [Acidimicrobiales bacterium]|nr:alpha/beta hydrolase [Acidimicrobiales bacterium]